MKLEIDKTAQFCVNGAMSDQRSPDGPKAKESAVPPNPETPAVIDPKAPQTAPAQALAKEEQLALYEEDLKEHDWGHQPC